jgi:hypothetical protein
MDLFHPGITFKKTGAEVKIAVRTRLRDLEHRLEKRNHVLEDLLDDKKRLRSYLVSDAASRWPQHGIAQFHVDVPSEDHQEIAELCRRVSVLEKELANLQMILGHLQDDQEFELTFEQMVTYGFREEKGKSGDGTGGSGD